MKYSLCAALLLLTNILLSQINSFPHSESFESSFTTGTNVTFIANWLGNEVSTSSRIFEGSDPRTGSNSLNVIPTSTFNGQIDISLDFTGVNNPSITFFAFSKDNGGVSSTRPAILRFSTSINGGTSFLDNVQIGDDSTFPNDNATSYTSYQYDLPASASNASNVVVRITVDRGSGTGSTAELVMDDFTIDEQTIPLAISSTSATSSTSVTISFNQEVTQVTAENTSNYSIDNGVSVTNASRTAIDEVVLTTSAMPNNNYQLTVNNVEDAATNTPASNLQDNFSFITPIAITSTQVIDKNTLDVTFNLDVDQVSAETAVNYSVDNAIGNPSSAQRNATNLNVVRLTFSSDLVTNNYELTVNNVSDVPVLTTASNLTSAFSYLPLAVTSISANSATEIEITFNQAVETTSATNTSNYSIDFGRGNPTNVVQNGGNPAIVTLTVGTALVNNSYTVTIDNVTNTSGNATAETIQSVAQFNTQTNSRQIVINEIFADPTGANEPSPLVLPNNSTDEYIELFNASSEAIDIGSFELSGGTIGSHVLAAGGHVILTATSNVTDFQPFGDVVAVTSWNTLTNGGEQLILRDNLGNIVDSLTYDLTWYQDNAKSDGGWSLEQINPELICSDQDNWRASNDVRGGSPGSQNSIFDNTPDTQGPSLINVIVNSDQEIVLVFDEIMDQASLDGAVYSIDNGITVASASANTPSLRSVTLNLASTMVSGTTYTVTGTGLTDCAGNAAIVNSLPFLFDNEAPVLQRIILKDTVTVDLLFDEVLVEAIAETESNYSINQSIGAPSTATLNATNTQRVRLDLANAMTDGASYTLTYQNLSDATGNAAGITNQGFVFENDIDTVIVISDQLLDVYFTEAVDGTNSQVASNYTVDNAIGNPVSATIDGGNNQLIHLAFGSSFPANTDMAIEFEDIQNASLSFLQTQNTRFVYDTDDPDVDSVVVVDENSLQVYFDEVLDQTSAEAVNNYTVDNSIGMPTSAVLQGTRTSVVLNFATDFTQELENQLTLTGIADPSGNTISTNRNFNFTYDTQPPRLVSVTLINPTQLSVEFSEELVEAVAENVVNYSVDNGIGNPVSAVRSQKNTNIVILTFTDLGNNLVNTLTISNVTDLFANSLVTNLVGTFSSQAPAVGTLTVLSDSTLRIQFTKELTQTSAEERENYGFDNGLGSNTITQSQSDASIVEILLTTTMVEGVTYRLAVDNLEDTDGNIVTPITFDFTYDKLITSISILSSNTLLVDFDIDVTQALAETVTNYSLDQNIGNPATAVRGAIDNSQVTLVFAQNLVESETYILSVSNLTDVFGDVIPGSNNTFVNDVTAPTITSVTSIFTNEIEVLFDEPLDRATAETLNHYSLNNGVGQPTSAIRSSSNPSLVTLVFGTDLTDGLLYRLTVDRVEDTQGKAINNVTFDFTFSTPITPSFRDIVINEIYFNNSLNAGIPNHEFIELYNNSNQAIELRNFSITDKRDTATFDSHVLGANEYLIITRQGAVQSFNSLGTAMGLRRFPSLSNTGETIVFMDRSDNIVDSLAYDISFYNDPTKENGGFTVELINPDKPCFDVRNFSASTHVDGGTPGVQNSVFDNSADVTAPQVTSLSVVSTTSLNVVFNEAMDVSTLIPANFSVSSGANVSGVTINDTYGLNVVLSLDANFSEGFNHTLSFSNITDCSGNALSVAPQTFYQSAEPANHELIITEIMATPTPSQGLPEAEYIELTNVSNKILSLEGVVFTDQNAQATLTALDLNPGEIVIVTPNSTSSQFTSFGTVMGVFNWPNLNRSGDRLRLYNASATELHRVNYEESWFRTSSQADGGFSLEMIDTNYPCVEASNWNGSSAGNGGTPGTTNAINANNPDIAGPQMLLAVATDVSTIHVDFDEKLNTSAIDASDFTADNGLSFIAVQVNENERSVTLTTNTDLVANTVYRVTANNITDCTGNLVSGAANALDVIVAAQASALDVVINEVLFHPNSGGVRFVEIYNNSSKFLNLKDWKVAGLANSQTISSENLFMPPNTYYTITSDGSILQTQYPSAVASTFVELSSLPNMPTTGGTVFIRDDSDNLIDSFAYDPDFHSSLLVETRGVSLERISFNGPSNDENNWFSASAVEGFATPGYQNSQSSSQPSVPAGAVVVDPPAFAPDQPGLSNFTMLNYAFKDAGNTVTVKIVDAGGNVVHILSENVVVGKEGFFTWDGTIDGGGKARVGYYMILMEIISSEGNVSYCREKVAIGTRF